MSEETDKFIEAQMLQAAGYAMLFAGLSEQETRGLLFEVGQMKNFELAETLAPDVAKFVADAFVKCIAQGKVEIEAANQRKILQ